MVISYVVKNQDTPVISVVMADYNTPSSNLVNAVKSILAQTFQNFELLIVDDASSRPTRTILDDITDDRLRIIRHDHNSGSAAARNSAIGAAGGEYIVLIDTDDWVEPTYISTLYKAIVANPEYTAISCRAREFQDDGTTGSIVGRVGEKSAKNIIRKDLPVHAASIMRRADLIAVGGYPNYRRGQDYALWCELLIAGKRLKVIEPVLYQYRVNLSDYSKRTLWRRRHGIYASIHYYPQLGASIFDYRYIAKSIVAGLLPSRMLKVLSERRRTEEYT